MLNIQLLKFLVIISFLVSLSALSYLVFKTFSFGKRTFHSNARGNPIKGIFYSLGKGMLPWEKESASKNIVAYFTGIFYHSAIFASLIFLFLNLFNSNFSQTLEKILKLVILLGFISGIGLFLRRIFTPYLRKISILEDFLANIIVNFFLFLSFLSISNSSFLSILYIYSIILFLYIPSGKIRHCFFFFYSKIISGIYFGWRGVFGRNIPELEGK